MNVRFVAVTEENLDQAPEWASPPYSCKYCLYWEHPGVRTDREFREKALERKRAWLRRVREEWGSCGKFLIIDDKAVGYAQYAPARFFPGVEACPAGPVSEDAVLISCLFIPEEEHRGRGHGSALLAAVLDELRGRDIAAVETFARRGNFENPSGPVDFYLRHGFHVLRDDPEFPLLRLELK